MFKSRKSKVATLIIGGMLLVGSVGAAFADTATSTTTATNSNNAMYQEFLSDFATNLGVTQDQVTTALQATKQQIVQEEVQQGKITQDQATKILASKGLGFGFLGGHKKGNFDITKNPTMLNNAATALGLTVTQLQSDLQSGQTLQQVVTAQGMTMQQFRQKMPHHQQNGSATTANTTSTTSTATN